MKQNTIKKSFTLEGKGLHTGLQITLTFMPAPANHGIRICRVDLPDEPTYQALADYVTATERGTVLTRPDGWQISTIEHVMAALYALDIDNCLLRVNAPEFPILNGSGEPIVAALLNAGIEPQAEDVEPFIVRKRMEYENPDTGSKIVLMPDTHYNVDVHVDYNSTILSNQYANLEQLSDFATEIASARTFVFVREIEPLIQANLIKGGDLENAIVIYDQPLSQERIDAIAKAMNQPTKSADTLGFMTELTYNNEPARHKLLDVIGDLALIGRRIQGKIIATRPGHGANTTFAKMVRKELKKADVLAPAYDDTVAPIYDVNAIRKMLPHRYPFLLVDKIISVSEKVIVGVKSVTGNEPFFQGHFPQEPVMPGVLLVEAMAQTGGILILHDKEEPERYSTYFLKIDNVKFRQKVVPGDTVIFRLELTDEVRRGIATMKGYAFVGGRVVTEAEFAAQVIKNK